MKKVIVIAPHPDDETLGCGGTIFKHIDKGDKVYWLVVTNIKVEEGYEKEKVASRQKEIEAVSEEYGLEKVIKLDFPTAQLDVIPMSSMVKAIGDVLDTVMPDIIYISGRNDVHSDHKVTFDAVISSTKNFRRPFIKRILMYEVISETEFAPALQHIAFVPNSFSDISEYLERKISVMKIYEDEIGSHPFPRSIENIKALATYRGATAGVKYAESFMILKESW